MASLVPTAWPWITAAMLVLGVGASFVTIRVQRRRGADAAADLRSALRRSLDDVDHQMHLLRNVTWWYITPLFTAVMFIVGGTLWDLRGEFPAAEWQRVRPIVWGTFAFAVVFVAGVFWVIRRINFRAVDRGLKPEREAIASVLEELDREA